MEEKKEENIINTNINNENINNINNENKEKEKENSVKLNYNPPTLKNELQSHILPFQNIKKNISIINGTYSNDVALIENCEEFRINVSENKKLRGIILSNSKKLNFTVLDSAVVMTRTIRAVNCTDASIVISDADIRRIELWGCKN